MKKVKVIDRESVLWAHSGSVYPHNNYLREQWYHAVTFLRETQRGWSLDKMVPKVPDRPLLHGYMAAMPQMQTVVALPDEQVLPGTKVAVGPWPSRKP